MSFNPYSMNGGTILGIAGDDYCLLASDSRLCEEENYNVLSHNYSHLYHINKNNIIAATGFQGDTLTLIKMLKIRAQEFQLEHNKEMNTNALAQSISNMLYSRRFFPYYVSNILGGLDEHGKGALYSYDPVGSFERESYRASGSAGTILQPFLDNVIRKNNQTGSQNVTGVSLNDAIALVRDVFISAAERDIHCGDGLIIKVITKDGVKEIRYELRKD